MLLIAFGRSNHAGKLKCGIDGNISGIYEEQVHLVEQDLQSNIKLRDC
jgi:hypothetical protein